MASCSQILALAVVPVSAMGLMPAEPPPSFLEIVRILFYGTGLNIILGLIALDLVLGAAAAIQTNIPYIGQ